MIFDIHRYFEEKKVKLIVVEFTNYIMVWWEKLIVERRRNDKDQLACGRSRKQ